MAYTLDFVDAISATANVRLALSSDSPWRVLHDGTDLRPPPLRRAAAGTLLTDGERVPAAAYGNRTLTLRLSAEGTDDPDEMATAVQALMRELDRPSNILRYWPETSSPVFLRTLRSESTSILFNRLDREVVVDVLAEPFALGVEEILDEVEVWNDPAEGQTLNLNPYFETDATSWTNSAGEGTLARSTAQFHEGAASLLLTPTGAGATAAARNTAVTGITPSASYRASAWMRCASARSVSLNIDWSTAGGSFLSTSTLSISVSANTWTFFDLYATSPGTAGQAAVTATMGSTPAAGHTLHIDEARLRRVGDLGAMSFEIDDVKGDVETPLTLRFVNDDPIGPNLTGIAVRRRGTPSAMPLVLQAESMTQGTDTSTAAHDVDMSGSGNNSSNITFATSTTLTVDRLSIAEFPTTPSVDARGLYRVFVRYDRNGVGSTLWMQMRYGRANALNTEASADTVTVPAISGIGVLDLGLLPIPFGFDPVVDRSGTDIPAGGVRLELGVLRSGGSDTIAIDYLLFAPADDRLSLADWPSVADGDYAWLDADLEGGYYTGSSGQILGQPSVQIAGGLPFVSPGVTNRLVVWHASGSNPDDVAAVAYVRPSYLPRYIHVKPLAT